MLKSYLSILAVVFSVGILTACHSSDDSAAAPAPAEQPATQPASKPIPTDSPFAKIKMGMSTDEVFATIGRPTSQGAYVTGKAWIPFNYGGDRTRMIARYKGIGTITFSQNNAFSSEYDVMSVDYDPNETGFPGQ